MTMQGTIYRQAGIVAKLQDAYSEKWSILGSESPTIAEIMNAERVLVDVVMGAYREENNAPRGTDQKG